MEKYERKINRSENTQRQEIENAILDKEDWDFEHELISKKIMLFGNIGKLEYDDNYFDAEQSLKILKQMPPSPQKEEAIESIKEKIVLQREGMALLYEELISIFKNFDRSSENDLKYESIRNTINTYKSNYKFSRKQCEIIENMLIDFDNRYNTITRLKKEYPDGRLLFCEVYKKEPKGKIDVFYGPVSVAFMCEDIEDYANIHSSNFQSQSYLNENNINNAKKSGGVYTYSAPIHMKYLQGCIIGINNTNKNYEYTEATLVHEEQHALNNIFRNAIADVRKDLYIVELIYNGLITNQSLAYKETAKLVESYCKEIINNSLIFMQDEILAYSADQWNDESNIYNILTKENGLYNYFEIDKILSIIEHKTKNLSKIEQEDILNRSYTILDTKYKKIISDGIDSVGKLTQKGYSMEKISGLLMPYHISKWPNLIN